MNVDPEQLAEEQPSTLKPALSFEAVTFSDGSRLAFDDDEITVFVGPNNAGKSAALRELEENISQVGSRTIIHDVAIRKGGTSDDLRTYLSSHAVLSGPLGQKQYSGYRFSIHESHVGHFDAAQRSPVASFFALRLSTETRITDSNPAGAIALYETAPQHPIHLLAEDDELEQRISGYFSKAFGHDLGYRKLEPQPIEVRRGAIRQCTTQRWLCGTRMLPRPAHQSRTISPCAMMPTLSRQATAARQPATSLTVRTRKQVSRCQFRRRGRADRVDQRGSGQRLQLRGLQTRHRSPRSQRSTDRSVLRRAVTNSRY